MRNLLLILTCLAAGGCTSSDAPPRKREARTPTAPSPQTSVDARPVLVVLGDSLAEGFGVDPDKSYPSLLQRKLDEKGYRYRVVNQGISGDTTSGGLARLRSALDLQPEVLVLELGGNDGLRGVPVASTKANLENIIMQTQAAGAQILLAGMTLPPNYGPDYIRAFEKIYKDLAEKYKLRLIPFLMEDIRSGILTNRRLMQPDGIHPSAEGQAIIAETVYRYLKPLLRQS